MALPNSPFGLRPITRYDGGIAGRISGDYTIADQYGSAIGLGDPVARTGLYNNIQIGVSAGHPIGVFAGCRYQDTLGNYIWSPQWLASTKTLGAQGAQAMVFDDPDTVFQIQSDGTLTAANLGGFYTITGIGTPNALGISQAVLHVAGYSASITDLKFIRLANMITQIGAGPVGGPSVQLYNICEVLLALHSLASPVSNN